jgi:hypothetical protein
MKTMFKDRKSKFGAHFRIRIDFGRLDPDPDQDPVGQKQPTKKLSALF